MSAKLTREALIELGFTEPLAARFASKLTRDDAQAIAQAIARLERENEALRRVSAMLDSLLAAVRQRWTERLPAPLKLSTAKCAECP